jgi:hypothetical protein
MKHLLSLCLIVLLAFLPSCKFFKGRGLFKKKADTTAIWQARQDSIRVADSIRVVQEELMAIENAKLESERVAEEERLAFEARSRYNIIIGSFITPAYAKSLAEEYRNMGYDTRIIKMEGSRFELVSAEGHENFRTAVARLKQFQDTVQFDSWLYIKK